MTNPVHVLMTPGEGEAISATLLRAASGWGLEAGECSDPSFRRRTSLDGIRRMMSGRNETRRPSVEDWSSLGRIVSATLALGLLISVP
jgi:hypothetical protein